MPLSKEAIESFREIYKREQGENLSFEEARFMAGELLEFMRELWSFYRAHENDVLPAPRFGADLSTSCGFDNVFEVSD